MSGATLGQLFPEAAGDATPVSGLTADSRKVEPGFVFVAVPGTVADGRRFAADFVAKRKLDQSGRGAGSSAAARSAIGAGLPNGAALGAGRSASDVLKSSTKPAAGAADFGGFKVVKAKGGKKTTRG